MRKATNEYSFSLSDMKHSETQKAPTAIKVKQPWKKVKKLRTDRSRRCHLVTSCYHVAFSAYNMLLGCNWSPADIKVNESDQSVF